MLQTKWQAKLWRIGGSGQVVPILRGPAWPRPIVGVTFPMRHQIGLAGVLHHAVVAMPVYAKMRYP